MAAPPENRIGHVAPSSWPIGNRFNAVINTPNHAANQTDLFRSSQADETRSGGMKQQRVVKGDRAAETSDKLDGVAK